MTKSERELETLLAMLPVQEVRSKILAFFIADVHARNAAERRTRRASVATDEELKEILKQFDQITADIVAVREKDQTDTRPLDSQLKNALSMANRLAAVNKSETTATFGKQSESLIFVIVGIVARELETLARVNPNLYLQYATGTIREYWLTTNTQSLCVSLNKSKLPLWLIQGTCKDRRESKVFQSLEAGFRGNQGYYASLQKAGFILEKENLNEVGDVAEKGRKVCLKINLDWIFGYSNTVLNNPTTEIQADFEKNSILQIASFFPPQSENSSYFSLINKKETEYRESGSASQEESSALCAKKIEEKEEIINSAPTAQIFEGKSEEKNCTEGAQPADNADEVLKACVDQSTVLALKLIFNTQNFKNKRIHHSEMSVCEKLSDADIREMPIWMLNAYRHINQINPTTSWIQIAEMVNKAIENRAQRLKDYSHLYNYVPKRWLDTTFSGGTLTKFVENFLLDRPASTPTTGGTDALKAKYSPQIAWLIEQGAASDAVKKHIRKFNNNGKDGQAILNDTITIVRAKMLMNPDFKPKKSIPAFVFDKLNYRINPDTIHFEAEKVRVEYKEFIRAKNEANKPVWWTEQRVYDVFMEVTEKMQYLRQFFIQEDLNDFVKIYKTRPANNEGQLKIQIEGLLKKRRTQQASNILIAEKR